jgi:integrative and conjugative element protein (TIGR02256 family)
MTSAPYTDVPVALFSRAAREVIEQEVERIDPESETGGILMGRRLNDGEILVIAATGPGPQADHQRHTFAPDTRYVNRKLREVSERYPGVDFVGVWHKHPPTLDHPSGGDLEQARAILRDPDYGIDELVAPIVVLRDGEARIKVYYYAEWEGLADAHFLPMDTREISLADAETRLERSREREAQRNLDRHTRRINEEFERIQAEYVSQRPKRLEDGSLVFVVQPVEQATMYLICPPSYPDAPPRVLIERDGTEEPFASSVITRWTPDRRLVDVVREAQGKLEAENVPPSPDVDPGPTRPAPRVPPPVPPPEPPGRFSGDTIFLAGGGALLLLVLCATSLLLIGLSPLSLWGEADDGKRVSLPGPKRLPTPTATATRTPSPTPSPAATSEVTATVPAPTSSPTISPTLTIAAPPITVTAPLQAYVRDEPVEDDHLILTGPVRPCFTMEYTIRNDSERSVFILQAGVSVNRDGESFYILVEVGTVGRELEPAQPLEVEVIGESGTRVFCARDLFLEPGSSPVWGDEIEEYDIQITDTLEFIPIIWWRVEGMEEPERMVLPDGGSIVVEYREE